MAIISINKGRTKMLTALQLQETQKFEQGKIVGNILFTSYRHIFNVFEPKIIINIQKGDYIIKTAENGDELEETLRLRHDVFYREIIGKKRSFNLDMDEHDAYCDHLVIIDRRNDQIVGTYRLIADSFYDKFYSECEFDIQNIKKLDGIKLELGRACIAKNYRNGKTILLLWQGLHEYILKSGARYLFGCASINTTDVMKIAILESYLRQNFYAAQDMRVTPKNSYHIKELASIVNVLDAYTTNKPKVARLIPSLLNSYLSLGAKVCGEPAYDSEFKCMDYLTILDLAALNKNYMDKVLAES
ncbi:MAG TPA: GNAT family N-acyltransferase [Smithellaceae bacterium]|nr:GNAT family N-acyltransferase [Smithellaceae bacterium]HRV25477.1 GNAT family N-acyltransferase [Smithellaceae bacterium]